MNDTQYWINVFINNKKRFVKIYKECRKWHLMHDHLIGVAEAVYEKINKDTYIYNDIEEYNILEKILKRYLYIDTNEEIRLLEKEFLILSRQAEVYEYKIGLLEKEMEYIAHMQLSIYEMI